MKLECQFYRMGTHPSGPARLTSSTQMFRDWLSSRPSAVGQVPLGYPDDNLPFLFKVLSIGTALSIQAHPDKILAKKLHEDFPNIYKDPNHKPEMAIALTPFEAMCGFRPIEEIKTNLIAYPELKSIIGDESEYCKLSFPMLLNDQKVTKILIVV